MGCAIVVLMVVGLLGCGIVMSAKEDAAFARCSAPSNDRYAEVRTGSIRVSMSVFGGYDCLYEQPYGSVVRLPPP
jgi:hypothetical protein